ncbi:MAG: carbamoyltransferase HypF [Spartobacteria bacterium]|nr:carbamoyltransferase HypF [Spartobacteria bacterium]
MSFIRQVIEVSGIVQGVGFRPAICREATRADLGGSVCNRMGTVRIVLEGPDPDVAHFLASIPRILPAQARIQILRIISREEIAPDDVSPVFSIIASRSEGESQVVIPADLAVCAHCAKEVFDPKNRRYGYPFTTCTDCGPRYTVVNAMPYDRERTTLARFLLCDECRAEYSDPSDRRFHAESIACPRCGPHIWLEDTEGMLIDTEGLETARQMLDAGRILAVRGIGGYLLAANAFDRQALRTLRERKHRPHKPFAVMAASMSVIQRYCEVPASARALLTSPRAPIVILPLRDTPAAARALPADLMAPDTKTIGIMLPTSPLHHLLLTPLIGDRTPAFELLIMTSANKRSEPICIHNQEARERLAGIADALLMHDREINLRNDDSVCAMQGRQPQVWRRARGYAPEPIELAHPLARAVLAMGAELKSAIALASGERVMLSPHIGDLETPEAVDSLRQVTASFPEFLNIQPQCVAVDLHPDMHSVRLGRECAEARGIPVFPVQHHHAHAVSCMAEHGLTESLALVFDGTGLGTDGHIWGAELLAVNRSGYKRLATFAPSALPGGDASVLRPARQLAARFLETGLDISEGWREQLQVTHEEIEVWQIQVQKRLHAPLTHAAGRLFDAFSVLLGLAPPDITYEGQAAIRLEACAETCPDKRKRATLPFDMYEKNDMLHIDWSPLFASYADTIPRASDRAALAWRFHQTVATAALRMIEYALARTPVRDVVLSGGVFMNRILTVLLSTRLKKAGLRVFCHQNVPPNDGGIALGQAVIVGSF